MPELCTHKHTHSLLQNIQRHCSSFLKGKVNSKNGGSSPVKIWENTHTLTQTRTEQQQIHTLMSAFELSHTALRWFSRQKSLGFSPVWFGQDATAEEEENDSKQPITAWCAR